MPPRSLSVALGGESLDVLAYNPQATRALLAAAGYGQGLSIEYLYPTMSEFKPVAEILQHQWQKNLGIEVRLVCQEVQTWGRTVNAAAHNGIGAWGEIYALEDPTSFLNLFMSSSAASGSGWSDPEYDALLVAANAIIDPAERMRKLAECERFLLRAMPCMPLYSDVSVFLSSRS